jgi:hypothetical protein
MEIAEEDHDSRTETRKAMAVKSQNIYFEGLF